MSYFFDGSSSGSLITFGEGAVVRYPFSISAWVYPLRSIVDETLLTIRATNGDTWRLYLAGTASARVQALNFNATSGLSYNAATTTSYVANKWQFMTARFDSNTNRVAFLDTVAVSNTTDSTQAGGNTISSLYVGTDPAGRRFQGYISDVSIRCSRTTATPAIINPEVLSRLAFKQNPLKVRGSNVVVYWPMTSSGPQKNKAPNGLNLTLPPDAATSYAPGIDPRVEQLVDPQKIFTNQLVNIPVLYRQRQMQGMAA
jgi:hypothetical protein